MNKVGKPINFRTPAGELNATALLVLALVMMLQVADVITTELCLRSGTGGKEANPIMNKLVHIGGWPFAYTVKLGFMMCICLLAVRKQVSLAPAVGYSAVGAFNNIAYLIEHKL